MQPSYILQPLTSSAAAIAPIEVPTAGRLTVGREATNDVAVPHDQRMSSMHFELSAEPGGCRVRDLGSTNGLYLNTKRIANGLLVEGDELQAGESCWRIVVRNAPFSPAMSATPMDLAASEGTARPPSSYASGKSVGGWQASTEELGREPATDLQLITDQGAARRISAAQVLTIGRTALADWVFDHDGQMSSLHMEVFQYAGTWRVKDLDSSNGTYLNESRISEGRLSPGDELRCGRTRFVVSLLPSQAPQPASLVGQPPPAPGTAATSFQPPTQPPPGPGGRAPLPTPLLETPASDNRPAPGAEVAYAAVRRLTDGREFQLPRDQIVVLGRDPGLPIPIPDDLEVSTRHATLMFDGQSIQLQDTGSSNGTFVAQTRVTTCQLVDGQRFRVGQTEFLICTACKNALPDAARSQPTAVARGGTDFPATSTAASSAADSKSDDSSAWPLPTADMQPPRVAPASPVPDIPLSELLSSEIVPGSETPDDGPHNDRRASEQPINRLPPASAPVASAPVASQPVASQPVANEPVASQPPTNEPIDHERLQPAKISPSPEEPSAVVLGDAILWDDETSFAKQASELRAVACRSGLVVYRGLSSGLDPVDVGLRVLQCTGGWILNGGDIENWMEAARQGLTGQPREWLNPACADDASWMLPFLSTWGSGKAWLVFASVDLDEVLQNILSLRPISADAPPLMPALTPLALAAFLSESDPRAIARFFRPVDALLVEVRSGQSWALFARPNLPLQLQQL